MSRKETIIVAALVNAALLMILFISALKTKQPQETLSSAPVALQEQVVEMPAKKEIAAAPSVPGDEVDQMLSQFTHPAAPSVQGDGSAPVPMGGALQEGSLPLSAPLDLPASFAAAPSPHDQASPAPAPVERAEAAVIEVKVKKGDALEKIARTHRTSVASIMKLNHLSSSRLSIGQTLKVIPGNRSVTTTASKGDESAGGAKYYTVRNGDNPWTIAVKNHMKLDELLKLNQLDEAKARRLKPGDRIRIQ